jgi:hypothetical protein
VCRPAVRRSRHRSHVGRADRGTIFVLLARYLLVVPGVTGRHPATGAEPSARIGSHRCTSSNVGMVSGRADRSARPESTTLPCRSGCTPQPAPLFDAADSAWRVRRISAFNSAGDHAAIAKIGSMISPPDKGLRGGLAIMAGHGGGSSSSSSLDQRRRAIFNSGTGRLR